MSENNKTHSQKMNEHIENALPSIYEAIKELGYALNDWHIFDIQTPDEIYGDIAFVEFHSNKSNIRLIAEVDVEGFTGKISTAVIKWTE